MKNTKKLIAALLAAILVLGLCACSQSKPAETTSAPETTEATTVPETEATTEATTEAPTEPAYDAAAVIAGFTTAPEKVNATFTQTYVLDVQNDAYQSFAKDVADTVTINLDLTAGNVYYYGKLVEKDGTVTEQLVAAEDGSYFTMTTTEAKAALADEAAAVAAIGDMMKALSLKTAGYVDPGFFTFNNNQWMTAYILLGSTNIAPDDAWFVYSYEDNNGGIKANITADYIGYFGDSGTFEFAKQEAAEHAAVIAVETDANGWITSFNEKLTSFQSLAIISPPVPLVLDGERTMTAVYGEDIARVETIEQNLPVEETEAPTEEVTEEATEETAEAAEAAAAIVMGEVAEGCTVTTFDFDYATMAFVEGTSVAPGHFVAFQVASDEGAPVTCTVNGEEATFINGYYCYMTPAEAGKEYTVAVTAEAAAPAEEAPASIVLGEVAEGCTVTTFDFDYATFAFVEGNTVAPGHFVAFQVASDEGAPVTCTVNGEEATFINGYYCYMTPAEAGKEYTVAVTAEAVPAETEAPVEETEAPTEEVTEEVTEAPAAVQIPVKVLKHIHAAIEVFDFVQGDYSTLNEQAEAVTAGNFLAVKVTPEDGYELTAVRVNNQAVSAEMCFNGYWCVPAAEDAESYTVKVLLKKAEAAEPVAEETAAPETVAETEAPAAAQVPVRILKNVNATIEVFDFVQGDFSTLSEQAEAVTVGNFLAVKVTPAEGRELSAVRVNNKPVSEEMCFNGYWCVPVTGEVSTYTVRALLK